MNELGAGAATNAREEIVNNDIETAVAALLSALRATVKEAAVEAMREERRAFAEADPELARKLSEINAKENITVPEAALLLGCSDSHLYKLIHRAKDSESDRPMPFLDLDGVTVLPRAELLAWARVKRLKRRKRSKD